MSGVKKEEEEREEREREAMPIFSVGETLIRQHREEKEGQGIADIHIT